MLASLSKFILHRPDFRCKIYFASARFSLPFFGNTPVNTSHPCRYLAYLLYKGILETNRDARQRKSTILFPTTEPPKTLFPLNDPSAPTRCSRLCQNLFCFCPIFVAKFILLLPDFRCHFLGIRPSIPRIPVDTSHIYYIKEF